MHRPLHLQLLTLAAVVTVALSFGVASAGATTAEVNCAVPSAMLANPRTNEAVRSWLSLSQQAPYRLSVDTSIKIDEAAIRQVRSGEIDCALVYTKALSDQVVGIAQIFDYPFIFHNRRELVEIQHSAIGDIVLGSFLDIGLQGIAFWNLDESLLVVRNDFNSIADIKGKTISVYRDKTITTVMETIGVKTLARGELEFPVGVASIYGTQFALSKYTRESFEKISNKDLAMTESSFSVSTGVVVYNARAWRKLTFKEQLFFVESVSRIGRALEHSFDLSKASLLSLAKQKGLGIKPMNAEFVRALSDSSKEIWVQAAANPPLESRPDLVSRRIGLVSAMSELLNSYRSSVKQLLFEPTWDQVFMVESVPVVFVTDRDDAGPSTDVAKRFGGGRRESGAQIGHATVKTGLQLPPGTVGRTKLDNIETFPLNKLSDVLSEYGGTEQNKEFSVYVHGYRNRFVDAVMSSAYLSETAKIPSPIIAYTWPSDGLVSSYAYDEESAEWTESNFSAFMDELMALDHGVKINLVCHSIGCRIVMRWLNAKRIHGSRIENLVLGAADISLDIFKNQIRGCLSSCGRITVYTSSNDRALIVSKGAHLSQRVGQGGEQVFATEGVDSVDVSDISSDLFATNHSYMLTHRSILSDLSQLVIAKMPPAQRTGLIGQPAHKPVYWYMKP
ncbi:MAG: TRAP transporter substrate-binding protein DctP [Alphaproteobacteria bacterium]|nr:TRAP transporter substrate-binding protein DctP [Alphaproteobacteria bacterium]